jgi:acyl-CoA thioesterase FadM
VIVNLIWRFIWTLLFSRFSSPVGFFDEGTTDYVVLPTDIDVLKHMNNGRYFSLMDLARIEFMIRNKFYYKLKQYKIYPVIASEMIRFKKSLLLFQRFQLTTRILGWDDKFFYIIHYFKKDNEVYALSVIKARMLQQTGNAISPQELLALVDFPQTSPQLPSWLNNWGQADQAFYDETNTNA